MAASSQFAGASSSTGIIKILKQIAYIYSKEEKDISVSSGIFFLYLMVPRLILKVSRLGIVPNLGSSDSQGQVLKYPVVFYLKRAYDNW